MGTMRQAIIVLVSVVFLVGGVAMLTPVGSEAEAGGYYKKRYKRVTNKDLAKGQEKTHEWLEKIEGMLEACPSAEDAETDASGRWVTYPSMTPMAVCDTTTGTFWEQDPDSSTRGVKSHADALLFCSTLGPGWELPEVAALVGIVDYLDTTSPANGLNDPNGPFDNVQSSNYWSATTNANFPTDAWIVGFLSGNVLTGTKMGHSFVWCVRSGS